MENKKRLALDVGMARIGVAISDPLGLAAHPLLILERKSRNQDFEELAEMVVEQDVDEVVCGLPLNMDGSEGPQAKTIRKWAMRLAQALRAINGYPTPVAMWDERLTTFAAKELMSAYEMSGDDDAVAAAVILQNYLDALRKENVPEIERIELSSKTAANRRNLGVLRS